MAEAATPILTVAPGTYTDGLSLPCVLEALVARESSAAAAGCSRRQRLERVALAAENDICSSAVQATCMARLLPPRRASVSGLIRAAAHGTKQHTDCA
jgi:hypothetical protein